MGHFGLLTANEEGIVHSNEYRISSNKRPRSNQRPPPNKHPLLRPLYQTSTPFE